ncbi:MAG: phosphodiester glycosidase family protein [Lachnospiraceae bacterium]|nr:phosphodiester glycosidase family protein [Lachnospiraceae bacterium]
MTDSRKINRYKNLKKRRQRKHHKKLRNGLLITLGCLVAVYLIFVFSPIPFIQKWRDIYIETAMTTNSHQWLATWFIPHSIIDEVMSERNAQEANQKKLESTWDDNTVTATKQEDTEEKAFFDKYWELDSESFKNYLSVNSSLLANGYDRLTIDNLDHKAGIFTKKGDEVLAVDAPNNTIIIGVKGDGYVGKLAIVKDISQVGVKTSSHIGSYGETAGVYAKRYDAEVVINASAFRDVGGHGSGGTIKGACVLDGKETGEPRNGYWKFAGIKNDGRMYISNYYSTDIGGYKWGLEFYPALIVDGKNVVDGTFGMGIQPRTAIGQNESGDFLMLIIDGRQVGYSLGCTVSDCEKILARYKAYQAMNLDGGSSAIMCYKGKQITKPSSVSSLGRFLPNALVVEKKK